MVWRVALGTTADKSMKNNDTMCGVSVVFFFVLLGCLVSWSLLKCYR